MLYRLEQPKIAATSFTLIREFKEHLSMHIEITDLGELYWMLGIEIRRDWTHQMLHPFQHSYIAAILCHFNFEDAHHVTTLMDIQVQYSSGQSPQTMAEIMEMCDVLYHEAVGSLMYLALAMRPYIAFAVSTVLCSGVNPRHMHWEAVK